MTARIAILGSTGSIGVNALQVAAHLKDRFDVVALAADSNTELLARQARSTRAKIVSVGSPDNAGTLRRTLSKSVKVVAGEEGLLEIVARKDVDIVILAISGTACLQPLLASIRHRKRIALANKEAIVSAGELVMAEAGRYGVTIVPIDSEHSAIFQCLEGKREYAAKVYLTGSGGPLRTVAKKDFDRRSARSILAHPKWRMGRKISVDSATMMNKGLEIIEARWLFGIDGKNIEVLIHPEAIVHSMVEFLDGSLLAQLGVPDMRIPIQYALTHPARARTLARRVNFVKEKTLSFFKPDTKKFPSLVLARHALRMGGTYPAVLNAADEEAVKAYLAGRIAFTGIPVLVEKALTRHRSRITKMLGIDDVLAAERWAKEEVIRHCYR